uniref:MHC class I antigen n=3 Tax=Sphenodon punctatus TaxID=8508 RepID=A0A0F7CYI0_SPHPU|nr:MHC class I antigen [Sphenodon punctatus]
MFLLHPLLVLLGALAGPRGALAGPVHSLRYFYTGVTCPGEGLPEFIAVGYLDDQPVMLYDSQTRTEQPGAEWMAQNLDAHFWEGQTHIRQDMQVTFRANLDSLRRRYNQSHGLHTLQLTYGCELRADGSTGRSYHHSSDGRDFHCYGVKSHTWVVPVPWAEATQHKWSRKSVTLQRRRGHLVEECSEWLRKHLDYGRESLRAAKPQLLVSDRPTPYGLTRLSCRAHGFYPRDITVVWLRNGAAMSGEMQSWGIVPSGDGTYQTRATIEIDPSSDARYQCCVEHESLAQDLRVAWEPKSNVLLIVELVIGALMLLVAAVAGIGIYIRNRGTGYKVTSTSLSPSQSPLPPERVPAARRETGADSWLRLRCTFRS